MRYSSSRGRSPEIGFGDALLGGLAPDGGLYLPTEWPALTSADPDAYADLATEVMAPLFVEAIRSCRAPISLARVGW